MKHLTLKKYDLKAPAMAVGCMRLTELDEKGANDFINTAIENGASFFDHADIYGNGECEALFAKAYEMTPEKRERIIIQTKCGIVPGKMYDFSYEHIIDSVNKSLKRLDTDYIDILLLHRPDTLMEPDEVARAFDELQSSGKVRHFGVSNHSPYQIELLQKSLTMPLGVNQLQLSIMHTPLIDAGFNVNFRSESGVTNGEQTLEYCCLKDITIQPWSPFQYGFFEGCFIDNPKFPQLNDTLSEIANRYGVTKTAIAFAWLLRHPAKMQPVTGTMNTARLLECINATEIELTRDEWYTIYTAAGNRLP